MRRVGKPRVSLFWFPCIHSARCSYDSPWTLRSPEVPGARSGRLGRPTSCHPRAWRPPPRTLRTHLSCAAVQRVRRPKSALGLGHGQRRRAPMAGGVSVGTSGDRRERRGAGNGEPGSGGGWWLPARQGLCRREAPRRVPRRGGAGGGAGGGDAGGPALRESARGRGGARAPTAARPALALPGVEPARCLASGSTRSAPPGPARP